MSAGPTTGFFTLGVASERFLLPHPRLAFRVILLVRRVLLRAFELLREESFDLAAASEDQVTAALQNVIENNLRVNGGVAGFSKHTYEPVVRQGQWANYNFTILTKTPDLCFRLRHDEGPPRPVIPVFDALFIECKPVDSTHPAGSKYCDDGLIRFVRGDYAWAMQEGMMLGYAREGRTIADHLIPSMSEPPRLVSLKTETGPVPTTSRASAAVSCAERIHFSLHRRGFPWPCGKGPASDITIFHVWCNCD